LFRLGDQVAVIPSLTGDGVAIALHSGALAAETWLDGDDSLSYHRRLAHDLGGQMRLASVLHTAAMVGPLQAAVIRGAGWFPGLSRQAARSTRLRHRAPPGPGTATVAIN
jgi:flavin-dependent dehydrogenase